MSFHRPNLPLNFQTKTLQKLAISTFHTHTYNRTYTLVHMHTYEWACCGWSTFIIRSLRAHNTKAKQKLRAQLMTNLSNGL